MAEVLPIDLNVLDNIVHILNGQPESSDLLNEQITLIQDSTVISKMWQAFHATY